MAQKQMPVYLFLGFLEGGKTHMIQESLEDQNFNSGEKTLLLLCEEGEEELDPTRFWGQNVRMKVVENEEDLTRENLTAWEKEHATDRVIIEYNGMWQLSALAEAMPDHWMVYQCIDLVDCATFIPYNQNMRSLMVEKLAAAEMVVFNRAGAYVDKEAFHKIVRASNPRSRIVYDYPDGHVEFDEIEDELPFDLNAPVVEIDDRDYAVWYRDIGENMSKYDGKTVRFKGLVATDDSLDASTVVVGRHIMTCCEADIAYNGLVCHLSAGVTPKTGEWILVTARIRLEKHPLYPRKGPVLYATRTDFAVAPSPEVATFY